MTDTVEAPDKRDKKKASGTVKAIDLVLRSLHVGTSSVLFGGLVQAVPFSRLAVWHTWTIASGAALIVAGICRSRHWPYQGRGVMAWIHTALLALLHVRQDLTVPVATVVLVVGVVGSKMPGNLRHYSILHRRRID